MPYPEIAAQLLHMQAADLAKRDELLQRGELIDDGYHQEMQELHEQHADALNEILEAIGYPTIRKVGKSAHAAAWLIIQHAIGRPAFMRKCAQLLGAAVAQQEADPVHLAYLRDRIAVFSGQLQAYGTQFDWDAVGMMSPQPHEALSEVNARRQALGLNTLEEQTMLIRKRTEQEGQVPPSDFSAYVARKNAWRREVGWLEN